MKKNVILWGRGWLCKVDLMNSGHVSGEVGPGRKRKQSFGPSSHASGIIHHHSGGGNVERAEGPSMVITKYRDIMLVDSLGPKELIVVERPAVDILQNLRPAYYRPKYGSK